MQGIEPNRKLSGPLEPPFKNGKNGTLDVGISQYKKLSNKTDGHTKSLSNSLNLSLGQEHNRVIERSSDKNGDHTFDLGVGHESNDGADSGVEVIRALSSNGSNSDRFTPIQSCGSSLISYSSEPEIDRNSECGSESSEKSRVRKGSVCGNNCLKSKKIYLKTDRSRVGSRKAIAYDGEGTSESCSETSSTHEAVTPDQLNRSLDFKRSTLNRSQDSKKSENGKLTTVRRSESLTRNNVYDKSSVKSHAGVRTSVSSAKVNPNLKSVSVNRNVKSGVYAKSEPKGSKSKVDEERWSSSPRNQTNGARIRVSSVADPTRRSHLTAMSSSMTSALNASTPKNGVSETKANALEKYGTLPRRPKKKTGEPLPTSLVNTSLSRSNSVSRDPSLNRAAVFRNQKSKEKENGKSLPPYPKIKKTHKTIIYHEVSVQTVITNEDISSTSSGIRINDKSPEPAVEKENKAVQTEGRERLKKIEDDFARQSEELEKVVKENEELRAEKKNIFLKISKLLGQSNQEEPTQHGLEELEQHFQAVGLMLIKQQEELSELRRYKLIAHRDLEKSFAAQKNLLQQQQEIEEEYTELQEFLQAEKTALSESLLDSEEELRRLNSEIVKKESLLEQQQEECKHLVRICEQRRQENLSLEAKLAGLDQRSRDVLVQQGAAVSAAAVALSGLGARLDTLVEQLSVSCNITDKDLEDIIFHNEMYNQSEDNSPSGSPPNKFSECPKRGESFLQVILGAIRNAAHSSFSKKSNSSRKQSDQNSERLGFFDDAETDTCLNFETALEENSSSFSNCTDFESCTPRTDEKKEEQNEISDISVYENGLTKSDSLQNLSDAILNRQLVEKNERRVSLDEIIPIEVNSLVDQIIDVDNLVTKLLKVIRIIQKENERCVEELQSERAKLTGQLHQEKLNQQKMETNLLRLQQELTEARSQLNVRISQLEEAKALCGDSQRVAVVEMQKRFAIIGTALGALNSVQDMVNKCPPLAQLRQDLEDCHYKNSSENDVNANSAANETGLTRNGPVLTTAI